MQALRTSVTVNRGQALASTARVARQGRANLVCRAKVRIRVFRRVRRYDQVTGTDTFVTRWRGVLIAARSGERLGSKHCCYAHVATFCGEYGRVLPWMCIVMCQCLSRWRNMPAAGDRRDDAGSLAHSLTRSLTLCARRHQRLQIQYEAVGTAYANALVSTAQAKGELEAVHADIDAISSVMKESADIKEFLANPTVPEDKKKQMIANMAAESGFNSYTVNFLNILVDQNRLDAISEVCDAFEVKYCQLTDTQVATLRSAVKLEQEQQFLIAKKLQELTKSKNVKIKPVVDESLIAGFIVEWGSSQIDLSVKGQLDKIGNELMATANAQ